MNQLSCTLVCDCATCCDVRFADQRSTAPEVIVTGVGVC